jgi:hypothetical protein
MNGKLQRHKKKKCKTCSRIRLCAEKGQQMEFRVSRYLVSREKRGNYQPLGTL